MPASRTRLLGATLALITFSRSALGFGTRRFFIALAASFAGSVSGIEKEHVGRISDRGNPPFHSADRAGYATLTRPTRC
jgi:hypothetical protein